MYRFFPVFSSIFSMQPFCMYAPLRGELFTLTLNPLPIAVLMALQSSICSSVVGVNFVSSLIVVSLRLVDAKTRSALFDYCQRNEGAERVSD
jgi:hypothetical protein